MKIGSLFTGYGGLDLATETYFGAETAWTSDIDPAAAKIIAHRFPHAPNLGDVTRIDWLKVPPVDIITGGSPCQDLSHAGKKAGMTEGTRSNLWVSMREAVAVLRPTYVIWENVRGALSARADSEMESRPGHVGGAHPTLRALGRVLGDLASLGYDAQWHGLHASDVGAPHPRWRVFVVATNTDHMGRQEQRRSSPVRKEHGAAQCRHLHALTAATSAASSPQSRSASTASRPTTSTELSAPCSHEASEASRPTGPTRLQSWPTASSPIVGTDQPDWGIYAPAIHRWELVLGRAAPSPHQPSRNGRVLSARFVEWMMGLPAGWVTDVPDLADEPLLFDDQTQPEIARNAQLKALGNGVVPQQAYEALRRMATGERVAA
jgi:DNA (cytosine-5)-methyltransferase 1